MAASHCAVEIVWGPFVPFNRPKQTSFEVEGSATLFGRLDLAASMLS